MRPDSRVMADCLRQLLHFQNIFRPTKEASGLLGKLTVPCWPVWVLQPEQPLKHDTVLCGKCIKHQMITENKLVKPKESILEELK